MSRTTALPGQRRIRVAGKLVSKTPDKPTQPTAAIVVFKSRPPEFSQDVQDFLDDCDYTQN
jgi:hypothetical protein